MPLQVLHRANGHEGRMRKKRWMSRGLERGQLRGHNGLVDDLGFSSQQPGHLIPSSGLWYIDIHGCKTLIHIK